MILYLGIFGSFSYPGMLLILSESLLCHSTAVEVYLCLGLYCVGDLIPLPTELPW